MKEIVVNINNIEKVKRFVSDALSFKSDIDILDGRYIIDGKSIMGVFSLDLSKDILVKIYSDDKKEITRFNTVMAKYV